MKEMSIGGFLAIGLLMFSAGIGIPVQAALNAGLGRASGSTFTAAAISIGIAFLAAAVLMLAVNGLPSRSAIAAVPTPYYLGGPLMLFYIVAITWSAPRIGIGNAVFFVLLGQLISASLIDNFGLFGAIKAEIDMKRIAGLALMAAGLFLARRAV